MLSLFMMVTKRLIIEASPRLTTGNLHLKDDPIQPTDRLWPLLQGFVLIVAIQWARQPCYIKHESVVNNPLPSEFDKTRRLFTHALIQGSDLGCLGGHQARLRLCDLRLAVMAQGQGQFKLRQCLVQLALV